MQNPGAAAGAAGAAGNNQVAPHIEPMYADNTAWGCYNAQQFKDNEFLTAAFYLGGQVGVLKAE